MATTSYPPTTSTRYDKFVAYEYDCQGVTDGYAQNDTDVNIRLDVENGVAVIGCAAYEQVEVYDGCDTDGDGIPDDFSRDQNTCAVDGFTPITHFEDGPNCIEDQTTNNRTQYRGFLKWSGITLPPGTVTKVELLINVTALPTGTTTIYLSDVNTDLEGVAAGTSYSTIGGTGIFTSQFISATGIATIDLLTAGVFRMNANGTFFYIGAYCNLTWNQNGDFTDAGLVFDSSEGTTPPVLRITTVLADGGGEQVAYSSGANMRF